MQRKTTSRRSYVILLTALGMGTCACLEAPCPNCWRLSPVTIRINETKGSNPLLAYKPYGVLQVISGSLIGGGLKYLSWALLVAASDFHFSAAACIGGNQESDFYF